MPREWEIRRISSLYRFRSERVSDKDYPPLSVTKKGIVPQLDTVAKTDRGDNRKLICKGDFAINSRSDRKGACGISSYNGSTSTITIVLAPLDETQLDNGYFGYLFQNKMFSEEFYRWGHGIVADLWTTNWNDMKKLTIPYPPIKEQQQIASYLNTKTTSIDNMIANMEQLIEHLEQYKRALIYEVVTGKKEI